MQKLKVLQTLDDVPLTLNELSQSGVGRAVRRLKSQPGELGLTARGLIIKWKSLLDEHIKHEKISISASDAPVAEKRRSDEQSAPSKEMKQKRRNNTPIEQEMEDPEPSAASKISVNSSSGFSFEQVLNFPASAPLLKKKKVKKNYQLSAIDDAPSTSSYTPSSNALSSRPSRQFTNEILSSLSEPVERPDTIMELKPSSRLSGMYIHFID